MKHLFYIVLAMVALFACSGVTPDWQAAEGARKYYSCLIDGNATGFLKGKAGIGHQSADYREELLKGVEQFQTAMKTKHGGLLSVRIAESHYQHDGEVLRDTTLGLTYAYLLLSFADSTQEEIVVPMVEEDGRWLMK